MSQSILILRFSNMCITIMSLSFSMSVSCVSSFLLGNKQEAKFGGVMSV